MLANKSWSKRNVEKLTKIRTIYWIIEILAKNGGGHKMWGNSQGRQEGGH